MYHIRNDKRAKKSAELIADAVMKLASRKSYADITITDIEKASTVARSTFYRLFDNTTDVLAYLCDRTFDELTGIHALHLNEGIRSVMLLTGEYWMQHKRLLEVIDKAGYQNILMESFSRHYPLILSYCFPEADQIPSAGSEYAVSIAVSLISSSLLTWARTGQKESAEELSDIIVNILEKMTELFTEAAM